jgi:hypothetical protein
MNVRHHRRLTAWLAAAATAFGLLVAAPAAQAVSSGPDTTLALTPRCDGSHQVEAVVHDADPNVPVVFGVYNGDGYDEVHQAASDPASGHWILDIPETEQGPGFHTFAVGWLAGPDFSYFSAVAFDTFQLPCSSVAVSPPVLALRGGSLTLGLTADGFGYPSGYDFDTEPVVFTLDGTEIKRADQDEVGHVNTVAELTAVPDCGSHVVTADYAHPPVGISGGTAAHTTLVVTCPTLTPNPASVPESALPTGIEITGNGWDPGIGVALSIDGAGVATATTDKTGQFTTTVPLAARPCGTVSIVGVELQPAGAAAALPRPTATTTVEVTCTTVTPTDPTDPTEPAPTLTADPLVSSGGVSLASGHGFTPGATVRLSWVLPDGSTAPGGLTTVVAADGSITASCLVLTHARLGPRTLRAEQGSLKASAAVLVVNGPMEPGRDRLLGRR